MFLKNFCVEVSVTSFSDPFRQLLPAHLFPAVRRGGRTPNRNSQIVRTGGRRVGFRDISKGRGRRGDARPVRFRTAGLPKSLRPRRTEIGPAIPSLRCRPARRTAFAGHMRSSPPGGARCGRSARSGRGVRETGTCAHFLVFPGVRSLQTDRRCVSENGRRPSAKLHRREILPVAMRRLPCRRRTRLVPNSVRRTGRRAGGFDGLPPLRRELSAERMTVPSVRSAPSM